MKLGSIVQIIGGSHEGKEAKILKIDTSKEDPDEQITLELVTSEAVVMVKRKRLMLQSQF